ncbi:MAG: DUF2007 domain-containing protein [Chloroflexi bacterium]|jgi:hypothetical protein|nr:DUF2007 domain-containing protein [Chloroflexota bacterium]
MSDNPNAITRRGPDNQVWYIVVEAPGMAAAEITAGLLRSANIPVFVFREAGGGPIALSVGLLGSVQIGVPEAYYEEALALLESEFPLNDELPPEIDEEP